MTGFFPTSCQNQGLIEQGQSPVMLQKKYMGARRTSPCTFADLQEREVMKFCPENTEHAAES